MYSIDIHGVSKMYGNIQAIYPLSLQIKQGELFGLIGPDGAGKTTLIKMLVTLLKPDEGVIYINGSDTQKEKKAIRNQIGYMPGKFSLYQDLTVQENLSFFAGAFFSTVDEQYHLIKPVFEQLEPFRDRAAGALSGGMKQKLALCCALIHRPSVLILDEPTTGVDAVSRKEFWIMLQDIAAQGITIVVSTPYMDEAALCDRMALLQNGRILAINTPAAIAQAFPFPLYAISHPDKYSLIKILKQNKELPYCYAFGESIHAAGLNQDQIAAYLQQNAMENAEIIAIQPGIEDTFIQLMMEKNNG
jgi:ABC-type multidrug transport system ATPase subunit